MKKAVPHYLRLPFFIFAFQDSDVDFQRFGFLQTNANLFWPNNNFFLSNNYFFSTLSDIFCSPCRKTMFNKAERTAGGRMALFLFLHFLNESLQILRLIGTCFV
jgi:hypothetical protein